MSTAVVLQPVYLPWLGFFEQLRRADVFVYYDDVQYDKHGWRNRIKTRNGPLWLTVPVRHSGLTARASWTSKSMGGPLAAQTRIEDPAGVRSRAVPWEISAAAEGTAPPANRSG